MNKKETAIKLTGVVTKCLPGTKFKVYEEENNMEVMCTLSGKLRQNKIRICENDKVDIEISVYDLTKGRIIWRY